MGLQRLILSFLLTGLLLTAPDGTFGQQANFELAEQFTADRMQKLIGDTYLRAN